MRYLVTDFTSEALEGHGKGFSGNVVIYGSGMNGGQVVDELRGQGIMPLAFCDAAPKKWGQTHKGIPILSPADAGARYGESALFIIAIAKYSVAPEAIEADIVPVLKQAGCKHIGYVPLIHESLARFECRIRGIDPDADVVDLGDCRMPNFFRKEDIDIRECFGFVILEHFHSREGREASANYGRPYDRGGSAGLHDGDIVIDAGANLGIFSAYAAAHGCTVHAFEPMPILVNCLKETAGLYPGKIIIHPDALGEKKGTVEFTAAPSNLKGNHIIDAAVTPDDDGAGRIKVNVTAIDALSAELPSDRIDFIKADIEGAERLMLRGAAQTLRRHAPRLAICSYHLPDDPPVLEAIIRKSNPRYQVENLDNMMYAWIET